MTVKRDFFPIPRYIILPEVIFAAFDSMSDMTQGSLLSITLANSGCHITPASVPTKTFALFALTVPTHFRL